MGLGGGLQAGGGLSVFVAEREWLEVNSVHIHLAARAGDPVALRINALASRIAVEPPPKNEDALIRLLAGEVRKMMARGVN